MKSKKARWIEGTEAAYRDIPAVRKPRLLLVTPFVPFAGISHAGGVFLFEYLQKLRESVDLHLVCPLSEENATAARLSSSWLNLTLVDSPVQRKVGLVPIMQKTLQKVTGPLRFCRPTEAAMCARIGDQIEIGRPDVIELHWPQCLSLVQHLRRISPRIPMVAFAHDVCAQAVWRGAAHGRGITLGRLGAFASLPAVVMQERRSLNACHSVKVFSRKDRGLLRKLGVKTDIRVMTPFVSSPERVARIKENRPLVVFLGALRRLENVEAMEWFLARIWPRIRAQEAEAQFIAIGDAPPERLLRLRSGDVRFTGYVEDPGGILAQARVFVAPLRRGAGVKFKVLEAMAHGLAVVGTPVALEGIADDAASQAVALCARNERAFANCVIRLLSDTALAESLGVQAREWVKARYDFEKAVVKEVNWMRGRIADAERGVLPRKGDLLTGLPKRRGCSDTAVTDGAL